MRAGALNKRVTIQDRVVTRDSMGGIVHSYTDTADVWAAIDPAMSRQALAAGQVQTTADVLVRIRHRLGIRSTTRFKYVSEPGASPEVIQYYAIAGEPGSIQQRKREIVCRCLLRESDGFR